MLGITGGTGFLGRAFVAQALAHGHSIRALVRDMERVPASLRGVPGLTWVKGTLQSESSAVEVLAAATHWVHLAAAGVQSRDRDWSVMAEVNMTAPLVWGRVARVQGVRQVLAVGTCLEYTGHGRLPDAPLPPEAAPRCAEHDPLESADPYGATKAAGGLALRAYARSAGLPLTYVRLASLYGPGDDPDKLIPFVLRSAREDTSMRLSGGDQVREWLHRDDAVTGLLQLVQLSHTGVRTLNLGTAEGHSLRGVVRRVMRLAGAEEALARFGERPYRGTEAHHLVMCDQARRKVLVSWEPHFDLDAGLATLLNDE